jgi:hypothetical protein
MGITSSEGIAPIDGITRFGMRGYQTALACEIDQPKAFFELSNAW